MSASPLQARDGPLPLVQHDVLGAQPAPRAEHELPGQPRACNLPVFAGGVVRIQCHGLIRGGVGDQQEGRELRPNTEAAPFQERAEGGAQGGEGGHLYGSGVLELRFLFGVEAVDLWMTRTGGVSHGATRGGEDANTREA